MEQRYWGGDTRSQIFAAGVVVKNSNQFNQISQVFKFEPDGVCDPFHYDCRDWLYFCGWGHMSVSPTAIFLGASLLLLSCNQRIPSSNEGMERTNLSDTEVQFAQPEPLPIHSNVLQTSDPSQPGQQSLPPSVDIDTRNIDPEVLMAFAESFVGTPYVYGSSDPKIGFDCSGFITYVFNRFNIRVPRSSIDFTNVGKEISQATSQRGDIILFTGTNPADRHVGHMGLVVSNTDSLRFIHSTSGKAMGVTISTLSGYYQTRFVKVIRIF